MPGKLITCPDCSKQISANAKACPGCGSPQEASRHTAGKSIGRILSLLGVILLGVAAYGSYLSGPSQRIETATFAMASVICLVIFIALNTKK